MHSDHLIMCNRINFGKIEISHSNYLEMSDSESDSVESAVRERTEKDNAQREKRQKIYATKNEALLESLLTPAPLSQKYDAAMRIIAGEISNNHADLNTHRASIHGLQMHRGKHTKRLLELDERCNEQYDTIESIGQRVTKLDERDDEYYNATDSIYERVTDLEKMAKQCNKSAPIVIDAPNTKLEDQTAKLESRIKKLEDMWEKVLSRVESLDDLVHRALIQIV
jgi:uncharacterized coiled-coil protein SlyX